MLRAVMSGKAGRLQVENMELLISWRQAFRANEDLLTGAFFGRLSYFSPQLLSQLMAILIGSGGARLGVIEELDLWPHLKAPQRSRVEPDVLIRFERATVMVEVKPPHWGRQSVRQWSEQLRALAYDKDAVDDLNLETVHFLALGGNIWVDSDQEEFLAVEELSNLRIHQREWADVAAGLASLASQDQLQHSDAAIVEDLLNLLYLYGIAKPIEPAPPWAPLLDFVQSHQLGWKHLLDLLRQQGFGASPASSRQVSISWLPLLKFSQLHPLKAP